MKKVLFLLATVVFIVGMMSCGGGGKYADMQDVMEKYIKLMDNFANDLDKAGSAQEVANALNTFSDGMKDLAPKMKALDEKYPELKNAQAESMPAELKPMMEKLEKEVIPKFMNAMMKVSPYINDPVVQEANKRFQEAMMEMGK